MQVEVLKSEGLRREYKVTLESDEIAGRIDMILQDFGRTVPMKGFRPGKAPLSLLKQLHGQRARSKAIEDAINDHTEQLFRDRQERPALQPRIDIDPDENAPLDAPVEYVVDAEILPVIDVDGFEAPALSRPVVEVSDADIDAYLDRLVEQQTRFEDAAEDKTAEMGDAVVMDFEGRIDGEPFAGGAGQDAQIVLGSGNLIQGFEDQLVGVKGGEDRTVSVTFPEDYRATELAGKDAEFSVSVKKVQTAVKPAIDDDLAKNLGLESLDALKQAVRTQIAAEDAQLSRAIVKRRLLDALAEGFDFAVPEGMVEMEYQQIWSQVRQDMLRSGEKTQEELEAMTEPAEEEREEYRQIAERRVRLGLLLSELGTVHEVKISRDDLNRKIMEEVQRYPGQEREVFEFYQNNEQARAQLRAPIYEDKVVDFILEQGNVSDEPVSREELRAQFEALDEEPAAD
ncbi:MAG: trigger factor [Rhodothalassiaceae bacterium]